MADTFSERHSSVWQIIERYAYDPTLPSVSAEVLAREAGVSIRTLRNVCHAVTGVSPIKYIKQRRMELAHEMLQRAHPEQATVTQIATFCGFHHLGRFSAAFRAHHGQLPGAILQQAPKSFGFATTVDPQPSGGILACP